MFHNLFLEGFVNSIGVLGYWLAEGRFGADGMRVDVTVPAWGRHIGSALQNRWCTCGGMGTAGHENKKPHLLNTPQYLSSSEVSGWVAGMLRGCEQELSRESIVHSRAMLMYVKA